MLQPSPPHLTLFEETKKAVFLARRNRFVIEYRLDGRDGAAYLPNPGRLRELLLPGRTVHLVESSGNAKFRHTAVAVERNGRPVLLHTHMANRAVEWLLRNGMAPGYPDARITRREAPIDRSRFDFLLERKGGPFLLEVKSCTLFEGTVAMFPDAVTARGSRHLMELASLAHRGTPGGVIFLVNHPGVRWFLPDYHTDPLFARTMLAVRNEIEFTALSVAWERDLSLATSVHEAVIPWDLIEEETRDSGSYLLVLRLDRDLVIDRDLPEGGCWPRGYYVYVGSAEADLARRLEYHLRKRRQVRHPIDALRNQATAITALPVRSSDSLSCALAASLARIAAWTIPGFGSSGCSCNSHLFGMTDDPERNEAFVTVLQHFRIGRLASALDLRS